MHWVHIKMHAARPVLITAPKPQLLLHHVRASTHRPPKNPLFEKSDAFSLVCSEQAACTSRHLHMQQTQQHMLHLKQHSQYTDAAAKTASDLLD
jgi:hypothetical protein